jgi:hypothetical protein
VLTLQVLLDAVENGMGTGGRHPGALSPKAARCQLPMVLEGLRHWMVGSMASERTRWA